MAAPLKFLEQIEEDKKESIYKLQLHGKLLPIIRFLSFPISFAVGLYYAEKSRIELNFFHSLSLCNNDFLKKNTTACHIHNNTYADYWLHHQNLPPIEPHECDALISQAKDNFMTTVLVVYAFTGIMLLPFITQFYNKEYKEYNKKIKAINKRRKILKQLSQPVRLLTSTIHPTNTSGRLTNIKVILPIDIVYKIMEFCMGKNTERPDLLLRFIEGVTNNSSYYDTLYNQIKSSFYKLYTLHLSAQKKSRIKKLEGDNIIQKENEDIEQPPLCKKIQ